MPDWRIYYDDGSTFSSDDGLPQDAPPLGVVVITTPYTSERGRIQTPLCEWDWYFWHLAREEWWGVDVTGLHDHLLHRQHVVGKVLCGRMVGSDVFAEIRKRACEEIKWPEDTRISYVTSPQTPSRRTVRDA